MKGRDKYWKRQISSKWPTSPSPRLSGNQFQLEYWTFAFCDARPSSSKNSSREREFNLKGTEPTPLNRSISPLTIPRTRNFELEIWLEGGGRESQWKLLSYHRHRPQSWVIKFRCEVMSLSAFLFKLHRRTKIINTAVFPPTFSRPV